MGSSMVISLLRFVPTTTWLLDRTIYEPRNIAIACLYLLRVDMGINTRESGERVESIIGEKRRHDQYSIARQLTRRDDDGDSFWCQGHVRRSILHHHHHRHQHTCSYLLETCIEWHVQIKLHFSLCIYQVLNGECGNYVSFTPHQQPSCLEWHTYEFCPFSVMFSEKSDSFFLRNVQSKWHFFQRPSPSMLWSLNSTLSYLYWLEIVTLMQLDQKMV